MTRPPPDSLVVAAPAKVNLFLHVTGRRAVTIVTGRGTVAISAAESMALVADVDLREQDIVRDAAVRPGHPGRHLAAGWPEVAGTATGGKIVAAGTV